MARFSSRTPSDLRPNRLTETSARLGPPDFDLTESNPTRCSLPYPIGMLEALADRRGLRYEPVPAGALEAREAIAREYAEHGAEVPPDRLLLTSSTSEAYSFLMRLLADPGDALLVPTPSYPLFDHLARIDAVELTRYRLDVDDGWRPRLDDIASASERCRAVVTVHPNNPTGSFLEADDADRLSELCRERGWALIADEVFLSFPLDRDPSAVRSFASRSDCLTFSLGGLSKTLGLPQVKLGWIAVSGPAAEAASAVERLEYIADAYLSVGTPVALAAPELLELGRTVRTAIRERCRANLTHLREMAASSPTVTVMPAAGGWSAVLRVPALLTDEDLAVHILERERVAVHPGYLFDLPGDGYLVVSLLPPTEVFSGGVRRLLGAVERIADGRS